MTSKGPIPTLGYPSQKDAIIALYEQRVEPRAIAAQTGAAVNSVHRAIHDYRTATGRLIAPQRDMPAAAPLPPEPWSDDPHERRLAAYRRAVEGARRTREAMAA